MHATTACERYAVLDQTASDGAAAPDAARAAAAPDPTVSAPADATAADPTASGPAVPAARVSMGLIRLFKLLHSLRSVAPRVHPAVDPLTYPLLFNLAAGPQRVSALAECVHSDISTVSRQVSNLAAHALLEKLPDPADGRAQMVRLTDEGRDLITQIVRQRDQWTADHLRDWDERDVAAFAAYLDRFNTSLERSRARLVAAGTPAPTPGDRP